MHAFVSCLRLNYTCLKSLMPVEIKYEMRSQGDENIEKYKAGKNLEHDVSMVFLAILHYNFDSFLRCHESARIFYNVLKKYGYNVAVVDGFYIYNERKMLHSWVKLVDLRGTKIIETMPQQVFPKLLAEVPSKSLVVSPDDERFTRYHPAPPNIFWESCEMRNLRIDENLVKRLSEEIFHAIEKASVNKTKG